MIYALCLAIFPWIHMLLRFCLDTIHIPVIFMQIWLSSLASIIIILDIVLMIDTRKLFKLNAIEYLWRWANISSNKHQAISNYLSQCCHRSMSPYGVTRPKCVNVHTDFQCFVFLQIYQDIFCIYPYFSGLFHWNFGIHIIGLVPLK